jgi:glyoxylase-like metal-dependent hydrolase (beta-lactamase superfamily II)
VKEVASGVWRCTNGVSNWYIVEDGGRLTLVDAGKPSGWQQLIDGLQQAGRNPASVECVLLTHAHSDHTGFAERARAALNARAHIHGDDLAVARGGKPPKTDGGFLKYLVHVEAYRTLFGLMRGGGMRIEPLAEAATFQDGEVLDVPGHPRAVHLPGHTAGSAAFVFEDRSIVCTGDALVTRNVMTGRVGPQVMPAALNQSTDQALRSLSHLESAASETVLPGHGEPWRQGLTAAIHAARRAGKS